MKPQIGIWTLQDFVICWIAGAYVWNKLAIITCVCTITVITLI